MSLELATINISQLSVHQQPADTLCFVLEPISTVQHGSGDADISKEAEFCITMAVSAGLIPVSSAIGIPGNIISAIVFYRQGLRERINVCLFALALADLVVVASLFLHYSENVYREFIGPSWVMTVYLPGIEGTVWASQFLSAVIASERCFCVVSPFHAKRLLKTSTTAAIIVVCCTLLIGGRCAVAGPKHTTACVYDPNTNMTEEIISVTEFYLRNKAVIDFIDIFIYTIFLPGAFLATIIVTTSVTALKLRASLNWRKTVTTTTKTAALEEQADGKISSKEVSLTLMLIVTSVIFVLCLTPNIVFQIAIFIEPGLGHGGHYHRLNTALWGVVAFLMVFNSSVNIIVYLKMGSKFREMVKGFPVCRKLYFKH